MTWSTESNKASLVAVQRVLLGFLSELKALEGLRSLQRVVCGSEYTFKVIVALEADKFAEWGGRSFEPEAAFLEACKATPGISKIETRTYTLMSMLD